MERSLVNSFRQCLSWGTFSGERKQQQNKENGVTTRLDIIFQFNIPCRECDLKIQLFLICVYSCWKIMCCHGILDSFLRKILSFCSFSWHCPCFCNNFITHVVSYVFFFLIFLRLLLFLFDVHAWFLFTQHILPRLLTFHLRQVGRVLLNALLYPGIKTNLQKNSIVAIFHTSVNHINMIFFLAFNLYCFGWLV